MELNDFEVGVTYQVKIADWEAPTGENVPGRTLVRRILEPADQNNSAWDDGPAPRSAIKQWQDFLRVEDPDTGKTYLLHPNIIEAAVAVQ